MGRLSHVVIIRFHYEDTDPRFHWRFAYFQSVVLPRLLAQTNQNFDIAIRCHPIHEEKFKALSPKIRTFTVKNEAAKYRTVGGKKYFYDFAPRSSVEGLPKYDIQTGLDSDDLIGPTYIQNVQDRMNKYKGKGSTHVCFQFKLFNLKSLQTYPVGVKYTPSYGSAFMSIYQPDKGPGYKFVYEESHITIGRKMDRSIVLGTVACFATVHGINESTGKTH